MQELHEWESVDLNSNPAILQLIAYTALTLASVTVATVSLFLSYRQNFGWFPIVLVTSTGLSGGGRHPDHYAAILRFEVWNRRRYPVVVRHAVVTFEMLEFEWLLTEFEFSAGWNIQGKSAIFGDTVRLEPGAHHAFDLRLPFKKRTLDDLEDKFAIEIDFFDPRTKKVCQLTSEGTYGFKSR